MEEIRKRRRKGKPRGRPFEKGNRNAQIVKKAAKIYNNSDKSILIKDIVYALHHNKKIK